LVWNGVLLGGTLVTIAQNFADLELGFPFLSALAVVPLFYSFARQNKVYVEQRPRPSSISFMWLVLTLGGWGVTLLYQSVHIKDSDTENQ
jgi:hypothetical protein